MLGNGVVAEANVAGARAVCGMVGDGGEKKTLAVVEGFECCGRRFIVV